MKNKILILSAFLVTTAINTRAQENEKANKSGELHGNFQSDIQYYNTDSAIGAPIVPEKVRMNAFANLLYTKDNFTAGIRYESYLNTLQGFDPRYKDSGIPYRFLTFNKEGLEVTAGNFYEQFGSGLILRTYEERGLGYDNVFDGVRLRYSPYKGLYLKGLIGKQRFFFEKGPGIVRGFDGELNVNEMIPFMAEKKLKVIAGGSFVSKYQEDKDPIYRLPENVGGGAGRLKAIYGRFSLSAEYASKINDPSTGNNFIYKDGEALLLGATYSQKGLGITLGAKRLDNMNFRSDRTAVSNNLMINYLPALTKQHTYNLAATIYPYATQPNGEMCLQAEVVYTIKKGSLLGGEYGTTITANYSDAHSLDTVQVHDGTGYTSDFTTLGPVVYFKDFNIDIARKFSKKFKANIFYANFVYNKDVVQGLSGYGTVYSDVVVLDMTYKISSTHAIRAELQSLTTRQDQGSWAMALAEYTISSKWFFAVLDQYNYGNKVVSGRLHYPYASVGHIKNANRITLSYGRQRAGIFCVGGICRNVPASNGVTLTVSSSF